MERYRLLKNEATADIAFIAYGKTLNELFRNIAIAVSNVMVLNVKREGSKKIHFNLHSENLDYLVVDFINKIIFYKDYKNILITDAEVEIDKKLNLKCNATAEELEGLKNNFLADVKAATLHDLVVKKEKGLIRCKIVLDV
ncbi:MAG: archease [Candidatus Parvarchaeota archaeon]|nr:archease [Candidatus Parvarchaeota archaeon]MCW1294781.1 archease [Candidatus Parvarchaeum tengchongense]MCW1295110.1 archease [Candidatus Parvarchaeum tengchongense]MCW1299106.1 archease [Candidatus Parvarchaeum tengchongense]MCW1312224.1 archease [Candidatus Parvarchaeum tengchongense]